MKKNVKVIVSMTAAAIFALSSAYSIAGKKGSNAGEDKKSSAATAVSQLALAADLVAYGDANKDAMALILAAKIQKQNPSKDGKQKKSSKGGGKDDKKSGKADSTDDVLARARALAKGDKGMLAMVEDVAEMASRGRTEGAVSGHRDRVLARSTDTYRLNFNGGERAEILITGDHDTDLDLYVYDENGNDICKDVDSTDTMYCKWNPRWTGEFRIEIKNLGSISNIYTLQTN